MNLDLSKQLFSTSQIRAVEHRVIHDLKTPGFALMTRAGTATANFLQSELNQNDYLLVLCGPGNNGGDGYVIADVMKSAGYVVDVLSVSDPLRLTGDAALAYEQWTQSGGQTHLYTDNVLEADVVIDALFGIGLQRDITGQYLRLIEQVNALPIPRIAVDIPSGLCSDTGFVRGVAIEAATTVTYIGLKQGLFILDGPDHCGDLILDDLGVPADAYPSSDETLRLLDDSDTAIHLPKRRRNSHKGDFGHICLIGGGCGMPGAVLLAGEAAARSGAGLVSVATHPQHASTLAAACPVLMMHGVENSADLRELASKASVLAIGPGLGQGPWAQDLFSAVMESSLPVVIDADALNLLAFNPRQNEKQVLTPHPGEAARLLGVDTAEVQADRIASIRQLQDRYGGVIVLKGQGTLIYDGLQMALCAQGNPGMASGGMGDLLSGLIAALIAQGLELTAATIVAVQVHAQAGDRAAGQRPRGLIATDLLPHLRTLLNP